MPTVTDFEDETPILWPRDMKNWLIWKDPDAGTDWRWEEKGMTEDEMAGWHHRLNGREFEQTPGVGDEQGSLVCCSPWSHKESDTIEQLNNKKWPCHFFKDCALPLPSSFIRSFLTSLGLSIGLRQVPRPLDWKHAPSSRHTIPAAQIC